MVKLVVADTRDRRRISDPSSYVIQMTVELQLSPLGQLMNCG